MPSDPLTCTLLRTLAASKPGGQFLELGSGTGLSTAWLLDGMDARATLRGRIAVHFWRIAPLNGGHGEPTLDGGPVEVVAELGAAGAHGCEQVPQSFQVERLGKVQIEAGLLRALSVAGLRIA